MILRIVFDFFVLALVLLCPWWLSVPAAVAAAFFFNWYWELVIFGLIVDLIRGGEWTGGLLFLAAAILLVPLVAHLRRRVRLNLYLKA